MFRGMFNGVHTCNQHGDVAIIEYLLKAKGDVERKDCDGFTALHDAAVSGESCVHEAMVSVSSIHSFTPQY